MDSCCESINMPPCIWFESGDRRNAYASIVAGLLFFIGWWIVIDAATMYPGKVLFYCGVIGTMSFAMVNMISNSQMRGDSYEGGCLGPYGAKIWLFLGFFIGFAAVIGSLIMLFTNHITPGEDLWPGLSVFLQNVLIFFGSLTFKFGRSEDLWG